MEGDDETVFRHACKLGLESCVVSPLPTLEGGTLRTIPRRAGGGEWKKAPDVSRGFKAYGRNTLEGI
jgi:hypothetical protein